MSARLQNASAALVGWLATWFVAAPPLTAAAAPAATLVAAVVEPHPEGARLALEFDRAPEVRSFALTAPDRLVLDLVGARAAVGARLATQGEAPGAGPVGRLRFAQREGAVRVVLDLAGGARLGPPLAQSAENGASRLLFVVAGEGTASLAGLAPPARRRVVVIDAGHGGHDPGAIGPTGAREKDVTLAAAKHLRSALERRGFDVVMTRDSDAFLPLFDRVARARAARAELFISLHADASAKPEVKGASVYTLSERGERRALAVADAQNWDLELAAPPRSDAVRGILMDLAQRETTNRSAAFAEALIARIEGSAPLLTNTHRNAGFAVLLAPDVPAILLEMGFMTNAEDERRLVDPARQSQKMEAVADAVVDFFRDEPHMMAGG